MKKYNAKKRISAQLKKAIKNTIATHDRFKSSFMWGSDNGNGSRRDYVKGQFNKNNPDYVIIIGGGAINVHQSMTQSRKNTYYSLSVVLIDAVGDSINKDVRLLKNLIA